MACSENNLIGLRNKCPMVATVLLSLALAGCGEGPPNLSDERETVAARDYPPGAAAALSVFEGGDVGGSAVERAINCSVALSFSAEAITRFGVPATQTDLNQMRSVAALFRERAESEASRTGIDVEEASTERLREVEGKMAEQLQLAASCLRDFEN